MADKYRVGIIGCGSIAHAHAKGYKALDNVELTAVSDPVPEALNQFGEKYDVVKRYADAREMLDKEGLDIVSVCTWHKLHAPMTVAACARKPKAVLCEKPMATNMMECDNMMLAAQRNNVKLAVGHQRRFTAAWNEGKRLLADGAIGEVKLAFCTSGNQGLLNDGSHYLDFMRYLLGDPKTVGVMGNVQRKTDRYERGIRIEECAEAVIQFDNSVLGLLLQEILWPRSPRLGGVFLGSDGVLEVDEAQVRLLSPKTGGWMTREVKGEDPFTAQARELVDWVEGRCVEHRGQAKNGRAAVEIIMAIYESARMHEYVRLQPTGSPQDPSPRLVHTRLSPLDLMVESGQLPVERPGRYDVRAFLLRGEETG